MVGVMFTFLRQATLHNTDPTKASRVPPKSRHAPRRKKTALLVRTGGVHISKSYLIRQLHILPSRTKSLKHTSFLQAAYLPTQTIRKASNIHTHMIYQPTTPRPCHAIQDIFFVVVLINQSCHIGPAIPISTIPSTPVKIPRNSPSA